MPILFNARGDGKRISLNELSLSKLNQIAIDIKKQSSTKNIIVL